MRAIAVTATRSTAFAAQGGAVLAAERVRAHLVDAARTFIFDTGSRPRRSAPPITDNWSGWNMLPPCGIEARADDAVH